MDSSAMHAWIHSVVGGGILAGVAAGLVLVLLRLMLGLGLVGLVWYFSQSWSGALTRAARRELWVSLKLSAYPFVGERALEPGFDARVVWLAVVVVCGFSVFLGLLFALVARGRSATVTIGLGILFGIAIFVVDYVLINPSPAMALLTVPSGLALALVFRWHERHLPRH